jgi:hypothetical protein
MSYQILRRLARLEQRTPQARCVPLLVQYVGDPEPGHPEPSLIVWVHRPGCDDAGHAGVCTPSIPAREGQ